MKYNPRDISRVIYKMIYYIYGGDLNFYADKMKLKKVICFLPPSELSEIKIIIIATNMADGKIMYNKIKKSKILKHDSGNCQIKFGIKNTVFTRVDKLLFQIIFKVGSEKIYNICENSLVKFIYVK